MTETRVSLWLTIKLMGVVFWCAIRHPLTTTIIGWDEHGKITTYEQGEIDEAKAEAIEGWKEDYSI